MTGPLDGFGQQLVEGPGVCSAVETHLAVTVLELMVDWGSDEVVA